MIKKPSTVDYAKYNHEINDLEAFYGLDNEVLYCRTCVISNQRPNSAIEFSHTKASKKTTINFDDNGICDACNQAKIKKSIDWDQREKELQDLCDKYRKNDGSYDCLVPGSGGKDSFYQSHILKNKYGMHPLTITWAPNIYTDWGRRNMERWQHAGFDNYLVTPCGLTKRLLTRLAVENLFHPFQPFIIGQKALAPKLAVNFDIPLIFYGENEAEYGNPIVDNTQSQRDYEYFSSKDQSKVYLAGVPVDELISKYGIDKSALSLYMPANPEVLNDKKIAVHYLGYYLNWHPQSAYYYSVEHGNFEASPERTAGTYSKYNSIDDKIDDFHYYTTYIKFGIGRAIYDAAQETRSGDLERDEALMLVRKYDGEFPERFAEEIFEYLSIKSSDFPIASQQFESPKMDRDYFDLLSDSFRSPHLWMFKNGEWKLRYTID